MRMERRTFLMTGAAGAVLVLAGCNDAAPVITVKAQGKAGMNPGPGGGDRPVTLSILQLAGSGAFDAADYFALQDPSTALGGELLKADTLVVPPGGNAELAVTLLPTTTVIAVVGGFRTPSGRTVRDKVPAPGKDQGLIIDVGSGGLSLTTV